MDDISVILRAAEVFSNRHPGAGPRASGPANPRTLKMSSARPISWSAMPIGMSTQK